MPVYVEIKGIEPEDLKLDQRRGESCHDHIALANLVYGALKNTETPHQHYDVEYLSRELDHVTQDVHGVVTIANADTHERITGRRPDYEEEA